MIIILPSYSHLFVIPPQMFARGSGRATHCSHCWALERWAVGSAEKGHRTGVDMPSLLESHSCSIDDGKRGEVWKALTAAAGSLFNMWLSLIIRSKVPTTYFLLLRETGTIHDWRKNSLWEGHELWIILRFKTGQMWRHYEHFKQLGEISPVGIDDSTITKILLT